MIKDITTSPIDIIEPGIYRHYKGNLYRVLSTGRHSETHEPFVVYEAQYASKEFGDFAIWIRPVSLFLEIVEHQGQKISRFTKIDQ